MNKEKLFLDTSWVSDAFGRKSGDTDRFKKIMNALNKEYDIYITDGVYDESVSDILYPKDLALKEWLKGHNIPIIITNTPPGRDSGEISIVKAIEDNLEFKNAKIASHDLKFFNLKDKTRGGYNYARQAVSLQNTLVKLVTKNYLNICSYKDLSENGSPNLAGGWLPTDSISKAHSKLRNTPQTQKNTLNPKNYKS